MAASVAHSIGQNIEDDEDEEKLCFCRYGEHGCPTSHIDIRTVEELNAHAGSSGSSGTNGAESMLILLLFVGFTRCFNFYSCSLKALERKGDTAEKHVLEVTEFQPGTQFTDVIKAILQDELAGLTCARHSLAATRIMIDLFYTFGRLWNQLDCDFAQQLCNGNFRYSGKALDYLVCTLHDLMQTPSTAAVQSATRNAQLQEINTLVAKLDKTDRILTSFLDRKLQQLSIIELYQNIFSIVSTCARYTLVALDKGAFNLQTEQQTLSSTSIITPFRSGFLRHAYDDLVRRQRLVRSGHADAMQHAKQQFLVDWEKQGKASICWLQNGDIM